MRTKERIEREIRRVEKKISFLNQTVDNLIDEINKIPIISTANLPRKQRKSVDCIDSDYLLKLICSKFNLEFEMLVSKSRKRHLVIARQIFYYLMVFNSNKALRTIALKVERNDHSTVIHGKNVIEDLCFVDKKIKQTVKDLQEEIDNRLWAVRNQVNRSNGPESRKSFIYAPIKKAS
jgi:chromosomal replication initiation ATPase DnaA